MMYSHSRLGAYETCPRKFAFQYIEKPDIPRRDSIEAYMGTRVHDALEHLYGAVRMDRVPKWEEVRDYYDTEWAKNWKDDIFIVHAEQTAEDYRNVGRRCLQDYFVKNYPFIDGRVLGLEEHIWVDLDGTGAYRLQGFIDRLALQDSGAIEIHDYKTSRRLPTQEDADHERQLALYQIAVQERWPDTPEVTLIWHYLRFNKRLISKRSPEALNELKRDTIRLIDAIETATPRNDFPPHESQLCDWCDFQVLCPAKRHLIAVAAMTPEQFSADEGVQLADRYAAAKGREAQAESDLQEAKDRILDFAKQTNILRLRGHNISVKVNYRKETTIPNQGDPNRKILESLVRASGQWVEVSDLSRSKLPKAVQTDLFDAHTRQRIAELLVTRETPTVTASKLSNEEQDDGPDLGA